MSIPSILGNVREAGNFYALLIYSSIWFCELGVLIISIFRWGNWDTGILSKLLKVTQWTGCKARDLSSSNDFRALFTLCSHSEWMKKWMNHCMTELHIKTLLMQTWKSGSPIYLLNICYMLDTEDTAVAFKRFKK